LAPIHVPAPAWIFPGQSAQCHHRLALDGTLAVVSSVNTTPTDITTIVAGNTLQLSGPADHIGWRLEVQTNHLTLELGTDWVTVLGSSATNQGNLPIDPGQRQCISATHVSVKEMMLNPLYFLHRGRRQCRNSRSLLIKRVAPRDRATSHNCFAQSRG